MLIPEDLKARLENFICEHADCQDVLCALKAAKDWVDDLQARGYPEHDLLVLGLAYQAYMARDMLARKTLAAYGKAVERFVADKPPNLQLVR